MQRNANINIPSNYNVIYHYVLPKQCFSLSRKDTQAIKIVTLHKDKEKVTLSKTNRKATVTPHNNNKKYYVQNMQ